MASFDPIDRFDPHEPPPRPDTPPVRRAFLLVLAALLFLAALVYGVPDLAERTGYAWEAGRSKAAGEALRKLDEEKILGRTSSLFRMAVMKVSPAVVHISSLKTIRAPRAPAPAGADGNPKRAGQGGQMLVPTETGSGFVVDARRGFVVTNHHVVKDAEEIAVRIAGGGQFAGKLVAADPKTDLAVVQISAGLTIQAEWADSDKVDVGDWVLAIGSPLQLERTVTAGIISATGRNGLPFMNRDSYQDFLQTDAALNPGNSGGPLIDLSGRVVGVNTAIMTPGNMMGEGPGGNVGIGMAISSNLAKRVVEELIKNGRVARGYLGVTLEDVGGDRAKRLGLPESGGAMINDIEPDSPAAKAGLVPNDVVVKFGPHKVPDRSALRLRTSTTPAGTKVPLTIYRNGKPNTVDVTIAELPLLMSLGVRLRDLPGKFARKLPGSPERAVFVEYADPMSAAFRAGLRRNARVVSVGSTEVSSKAEADAAASRLNPAEGITMQVDFGDGRPVPIIINGNEASGRHQR